MQLNFGFCFEDIYRTSDLMRLDQIFLQQVQQADATLAQALADARRAPDSLAAKQEAELLMALAPHLDSFITALFKIETAAEKLAFEHHQLAPLYACKRLFVQRRAAAKVKAEEVQQLDADAIASELAIEFCEEFSELAFATHVIRWMSDEAAHAEILHKAMLYAAWALFTEAGRTRHQAGQLFKLVKKWTDLSSLVPRTTEMVSDASNASATYAVHRLEHIRRRVGFELTDKGTDLRGALAEANYCIWCHEQERDSCAKGIREKPPVAVAECDAAAPIPIVYKKNAAGITLAGCPLSVKISEFQKLKASGFSVGALAMIVVDNPMLAVTGHRICNDCMKSCIYQKQQPVDIPQTESRTLKDVLALPWGFEIYSLLTRWNPLHLRRPYPLAASGKRVLVAGMGPAGFTLAHHLINDGHIVVGIDGLKIEPLPATISGVDQRGQRVPFTPVEDVTGLYESLDDRIMAGFGGVAEYGITVRWDKNFLKLARLLLERRSQFALFGGVRFGGTITADDAFAFGFDHIALALGAGKPTVLDIPNGLARGVRTASDFLMALQLSGAARADSLANLQLRLPVVVIGGGLTAIDTATEALAYYPVQVEKFLRRYEILCAAQGVANLRGNWAADEASVADEYLLHAQALRTERAAAELEGRAARIAELLQSWGGVTVAYRKRLIDSPAYTLNHEEVEKALEEGIRFAECLTPVAVEIDSSGAARALRVAIQQRGGEGAWSESGHSELPAHSILVAAGTQPNTVLAREDETHFTMDGRYFQACDEAGTPVKPQYAASKPDPVRVFLHKRNDGRMISFFGDLHPSYFGNVVKAMGSAKQGYPAISGVLKNIADTAIAQTPRQDAADDASFLARTNQQLRATVHQVNRLTPSIVEIVVHAPMAASKFEPGQFYRLQNFESLAAQVDCNGLSTRLAMEGLALTGAWVDRERGLISTIVLEMGGSSSLCASLQVGEPVIMMGPTGAPTEIPNGETVVLVGGGLGNAVLFSIGAALRQAGCKVLYFAGYKKLIDRYKVEEIENAADVIVWCCDEAPGFAAHRAQDKTFVGNMVQAMQAYAAGELGESSLLLADAERIIAIGSDRMMAAVAAARHTLLKPFLKKDHAAIGSINSPMQCMMKEICAQCLQKHVDPLTGKVTYVFSCFNQDQSLDTVDWPSLNQRLRQNGVQEKLTAQWIALCTLRQRQQKLTIEAQHETDYERPTHRNPFGATSLAA